METNYYITGEQIAPQRVISDRDASYEGHVEDPVDDDGEGDDCVALEEEE